MITKTAARCNDRELATQVAYAFQAKMTGKQEAHVECVDLFVVMTRRVRDSVTLPDSLVRCLESHIVEWIEVDGSPRFRNDCIGEKHTVRRGRVSVRAISHAAPDGVLPVVLDGGLFEGVNWQCVRHFYPPEASVGVTP